MFLQTLSVILRLNSGFCSTTQTTSSLQKTCTSKILELAAEKKNFKVIAQFHICCVSLAFT